jgi:putative membrane protein insertion efficiency factor
MSEQHEERAVKHVMIALVRAYQSLLSPLLPRSCVYTPSCSNYALEALERHGCLRGGRLALLRLLRCWPWNGGEDPVPAEGARKHRHPPPQHASTHAGVQPAAPVQRGS